MLPSSLLLTSHPLPYSFPSLSHSITPPPPHIFLSSFLGTVQATNYRGRRRTYCKYSCGNPSGVGSRSFLSTSHHTQTYACTYMQIYADTLTHWHIFTHAFIHAHTRSHTQQHTRAHIHIQTLTHWLTHSLILIYVRSHVCIHVCVHTRTHTHSQIHTTHICTLFYNLNC